MNANYMHLHAVGRELSSAGYLQYVLMSSHRQTYPERPICKTHHQQGRSGEAESENSQINCPLARPPWITQDLGFVIKSAPRAASPTPQSAHHNRHLQFGAALAAPPKLRSSDSVKRVAYFLVRSKQRQASSVPPTTACIGSRLYL